MHFPLVKMVALYADLCTQKSCLFSFKFEKIKVSACAQVPIFWNSLWSFIGCHVCIRILVMLSYTNYWRFICLSRNNVHKRIEGEKKNRNRRESKDKTLFVRGNGYCLSALFFSVKQAKQIGSYLSPFPHIPLPVAESKSTFAGPARLPN